MLSETGPLLSEGDTAPDFSLPRDGGATVNLSDFAGKAVVLYFYPKDDTPGCTTEAQDFTASRDDFAAAGAVVLGVSKDPVTKHDKFVAKREIGIPLLSDADSDVCERYGVWGEKQMYGKSYFGIERSTFLIGPDGTIARIWRKVKVPGHAGAVLDAVREL
ncbi:thioredoxin-dependent thiol peroxidase [Loktanella sp. M215]|uniref:thioredoxin-dependent thiol peroxidase n=1 Tax=Loktanella sp. M215 TaxID=2675431 RepID=UPI001F021391|nr:thioredoxin-dependent thiol peroxidase [Loktanella sp. M215]MCF7700010.1 thioredoxin-dependent thiol peroxidase [Loktanella sp. M215]